MFKSFEIKLNKNYKLIIEKDRELIEYILIFRNSQQYNFNDEKEEIPSYLDLILNISEEIKDFCRQKLLEEHIINEDISKSLKNCLSEIYVKLNSPSFDLLVIFDLPYSVKHRIKNPIIVTLEDVDIIVKSKDYRSTRGLLDFIEETKSYQFTKDITIIIK